jgi:hypothetical protein
LLAEEVSDQTEVFRAWRVGRESYHPCFLIFILLLDATSQRLGLKGRFLLP